MARAYKVRLGDGSEIDLKDLQAVKDWRAQGLIDKDSQVLAPGSKSWVSCAELLKAGKAREARASSPGPVARSRPKPAGKKARAEEEAPEEEETVAETPQAWRTVVAGVLFLLGGGASGYLAFHPERWLPALDGTPWKEMALAQLLFGLCLIRGWEIGRKLVRVAVLLLGFAVFPVGGILVAQGVRGRPLLVLLSAGILLAALFAFLSGSSLSAPRSALSLLLVLAGGGGVGYYGVIPESAETQRVREWAAAERRFADDALGVGLAAPEGWLLLRKEQTLVTAPPEAKLVLAQPRLGGFAFLAAVSSPRGIVSLEEYLGRVLEGRRKGLASFKETGRKDVVAGQLTGREVLGSWEAEGTRYQDVTAAWRNGWTFIALVGWVPDDGSTRSARELESLVGGLSLSAVMANRLQDAVRTAASEVPLLSAQAAEMLMGRSEAQVLEPPEIFRRAYQMASQGLASLTDSESRELGALTSALYASMSKKDRTRLGAYFDRVRARQLTLPEEDREMSSLFKDALLKLPSARLARLQALYEKAIRAAVTAG